MLSSARNILRDDDGVFEKAQDFSELGLFDCGHEDLNDFIRNDASKYREHLLAETFIYRFLDDEGRASGPVAFVSLSNDLLTLTLPKAQRKSRSFSTSAKKQRREVPNSLRWSAYPAVKVARLGVYTALCRRGVGTKLLNILKTLFTTENRTGCRFITVDAYNEQSVLSFYEKNDFAFLYDDDEKDRTRTMFYDLKRFIGPLE